MNVLANVGWGEGGVICLSLLYVVVGLAATVFVVVALWRIAKATEAISMTLKTLLPVEIRASQTLNETLAEMSLGEKRRWTRATQHKKDDKGYE